MVSKKELRDPKKGLKDTRIVVYWPKEEIDCQCPKGMIRIQAFEKEIAFTPKERT